MHRLPCGRQIDLDALIALAERPFDFILKGRKE